MSTQAKRTVADVISKPTIFPFSDSFAVEKTARRHLAVALAHDHTAADYREVADSWRRSIARRNGVEFGDVRDRHKARNAMHTAERVAKALEALEG